MSTMFRAHGNAFSHHEHNTFARTVVTSAVADLTAASRRIVPGLTSRVSSPSKEVIITHSCIASLYRRFDIKASAPWSSADEARMHAADGPTDGGSTS